MPDAVLEVEREHIRARIRRIVVDNRALTAAIEAGFGVDFDPRRWEASFDSLEPEAVNAVATVISGYERIVNGLVEAARGGLVAGGVAQPVGTPDSVRKDLERVRDDGGLTKGQVELLVGLSRTRNELQHVYIEVTADDARDAVRKLRSNLPTLIKALNAWFTRYGVGV